MNKIILHYEKDKIMELEWNKHNYEYHPDNEGEIKNYILRFEPDGSLFICTFDKDGKYIDNVSESLHPLYLEFITQEECPECEDGKIKKAIKTKIFFGDDSHVEELLELVDCENCTDGRVETLTQKVLFKPDEYDEKICEDFWQSTNAKESK